MADENRHGEPEAITEHHPLSIAQAAGAEELKPVSYTISEGDLRKVRSGLSAGYAYSGNRSNVILAALGIVDRIIRPAQAAPAEAAAAALGSEGRHSTSAP